MGTTLVPDVPMQDSWQGLPVEGMTWHCLAANEVYHKLPSGKRKTGLIALAGLNYSSQGSIDCTKQILSL